MACSAGATPHCGGVQNERQETLGDAINEDLKPNGPRPVLLAPEQVFAMAEIIAIRHRNHHAGEREIAGTEIAGEIHEVSEAWDRGAQDTMSAF